MQIDIQRRWLGGIVRRRDNEVIRLRGPIHRRAIRAIHSPGMPRPLGAIVLDLPARRRPSSKKRQAAIGVGLIEKPAGHSGNVVNHPAQDSASTMRSSSALAVFRRRDGGVQLFLLGFDGLQLVGSRLVGDGSRPRGALRPATGHGRRGLRDREGNGAAHSARAKQIIPGIAAVRLWFIVVLPRAITLQVFTVTIASGSIC